MSRVNHGFEVGSNPHPRFTCKKLKKYAVSRLNVIMSSGVYKKKTEKRLLQTAPMFAKSN
jgi:hypothetical protein